MAFTKPTKVARFGGTSVAETGNSTEPASAVKDTGWVLDDEPPSSIFNWLHYRAYKWFRWFNERCFDGGSAVDFRVKAPAVATAADNGGDLELYGANSGANANLNGGDVVIEGGDATGTGSSQVKLRAATRGAAGVGARVASDYLVADGSTQANGATPYGVVLGKQPLEVTTPAGSDADAIRGDATAGDGHGVTAKADTTAPVSSALYVVPQAADPSSPANGDVFVHDTTDQIAHYSAALGRYQAMDPVVMTIDNISDNITDADANWHVFQEAAANIQYAIPANTLRVGTIIRLRASGYFTWVNNQNISLRWRIGTLIADSTFANTANGEWVCSVDAIVNSLGVAGVAAGCSVTYYQEAAAATPYISDTNANPFDTTGAANVYMEARWGGAAAGNLIAMRCFSVEII